MFWAVLKMAPLFEGVRKLLRVVAFHEILVAKIFGSKNFMDSINKP